MPAIVADQGSATRYAGLVVTQSRAWCVHLRKQLGHKKIPVSEADPIYELPFLLG